MSIVASAILALALPASGSAILQDKDPNKIICKSEENTGSRLQRRRKCHTRAEWGEMDRERNRKADSEGSPFRNEETIKPQMPFPGAPISPT